MLDLLPYFAGQSLYALPMLLGLVLIGVRARGTARALGVVGCLIMLIGHILSSIWTIALPWAMREFDLPAASLSIPSVILGLISAVGLVLVICAVVAGRSSASPVGGPPPTPPNQYGQQPNPYGQQPNQYGQPPNPYGQPPQ